MDQSWLSGSKYNDIRSSGAGNLSKHDNFGNLEVAEIWKLTESNPSVFGVSGKVVSVIETLLFAVGRFPAGGLGQGSVDYATVPKGYATAPENTTLQKYLNIWFPPSPVKTKKRERRLAKLETSESSIPLSFESFTFWCALWASLAGSFAEALVAQWFLIMLNVSVFAKHSFGVQAASLLRPRFPKGFSVKSKFYRHRARSYWYSLLLLNNHRNNGSFLVVPLWNVYFARLWNEFPWVIDILVS